MLTTEWIPSTRPNSKRLLVVLHGLGDSLEGWRWLPSELRLPQLNYLLVNAPDDYYGGFSWYDINGDSGPGIRRSRAQLTALLDQQRAAGFPSAETALLGFSQGCLMTIDVGFRYPHRLAALVGVSGYVWEPEVLLRELSPVARDQTMLFTHGTRDPLIPCDQVRHQVQALRAAGLEIDWREFDKVHTVAGEAELSIIRQFLDRRSLASSLHSPP
ncbi:MAG TPA: serine esterase [Verrucomicrobiota bacterium]|nr:serine esterase [Verrucomicrobiota bacterium]